ESGEPEEIPVETWTLTLDDQGKANVQCNAKEKGQYRFSFDVKDKNNHVQKGGVLFTIVGDENSFDSYRFNEIELIQEKREYRPGESVKLLVNTKLENATVALFLRPVNGIYIDPMIITMQGKSRVVEIPVTIKDMPNFFIEALTVQSGRVYSTTREIIVPPEKRILNLEVTPQKENFKPGEEATVKVKVTDHKGNPFTGSLVMTIYDKSLEYISGGSNLQDIRTYFWKWRRNHHPRTEHNLERTFIRILKKLQIDMQSLGVFGHTVADDEFDREGSDTSEYRLKNSVAAPLSAKMDSVGAVSEMETKEGFALGDKVSEQKLKQDTTVPKIVPTVRKAFADTAYWNARLMTDANGIAEVSFTMPENLSTWKVKTWGMGHGTRVGEGEAEVITTKDLLLRLQSPRFFVEKDEVVLSANIHNELDTDKEVTAKLVLSGDTLSSLVPEEITIQVPAHGEARVDWRVKALKEGEAVIQMQALTDEESDAMEMSFPVYVHGIEKRISISGHIPSTVKHKTFRITIPEDRRKGTSRLEIRYSPTLAGAMVDALPYLVDYPYGCTEQTLNRFVPTVITQSILKNLDLDLKDIKEKRTNLNAQEIGDDSERARQWKRYKRNPVFDEALVQDMVEIGVLRLSNMQLSDGGWGWFSGWGERSYPHTTAVVVHGIQIAKKNGIVIPEAVLNNGINWLESYQAKELTKILNWPKEKNPRKKYPDDMDALTYMILTDAGKPNSKMRDIMYRDRSKLSVYGLTLLGMSLFVEEKHEQLNMVIRNIEQFLVQDDENQTAYLSLPNNSYWWYWYGSEYETHAYYLKLLSLTGRVNDGKASGLVKYLLNNRKHATYWKSTRDTAVVIEAFADYLEASKEHQTDIRLEILVDDAKRKEVHINSDNLFTFDNTLLITGEELKSGIHNIKIIKNGEGPLYYNAYLDYFSLEDPITAAGLEIKVNRKYYRLEELKVKEKVPGSHGQALDQRVEKWKRHEIKPGDILKSGDLVLVELSIESKNDYEYIVFEDWKAAGLEPVEVRSGYNGNEMNAYVEYRDEKVSMFVRQLARGKHSISYRLRAEIPGKFSALPTLGFAMYAPELKANGDEYKIQVTD
ncbi:MAG: alpha-2-macroglobulin family protein, partial [Planctomycetota bacterium]